MRRTLIAVACAAALVLVSGVSAATANSTGSDSPQILRQPQPSWLTDRLEARIAAAGPRGVDVPLKRKEALEVNCLGTAPPAADASGVSLQAVAAGTCMVAPHGCTMNFVFTDGSSQYIGTAGHCVRRDGGRTVIAQVATRVDPTDTLIVTLAQIGKATKVVDQGIGKDFALVKIDSGFRVVPGVSGALGPTGVFCDDPVGQPVMHYGHGYVFFVGQGHPKFGEVVPDLDAVFNFRNSSGFNWIGYGLPGDSGSGVMNAAGLAVGDLTHGIGVAGVPVPGLNFGTEMGAIFDIIGGGYSLVTADGRRADCDRPLGV